MARLAALVAAALSSTLLLAGCSQEAPPEESNTGEPCLGIDASTNVATWTKHGGAWGELAQAGGRSQVVCGIADKALTSLTSDLSGPFGDVEVNVDFQMLAGDSGAGIVLHFADEQNYNIVRYSIREQGWHLFTMVAGNRQKQDDASVTPPTTNPEFNEWVSLRVTSQGGHIQAFDGTTKVIDHHLSSEASHVGRVGYFLRDSDMVALFDDFSVVAP